MDGLKKWQKALLVAGTAGAAAGLAWYLLRDEGEEEEDEQTAQGRQQPSGFRAPPGLSLDEATNMQATRGGAGVGRGPVPGGVPGVVPGVGPMPSGIPGGPTGPLGQALWYKNIDPRGCSIGIRNVPDVTAAKTGNSIFPHEVFPVTEVMQVPGDQQVYLRLADGRGWAFTHSGNDGRLLAVQVSAEEARMGMDPHLRDQIARNEALNPEFVSLMAENSTRVQEALGRNSALQADLMRDPAALGASLRAAAAAAAEAGGPPLQPLR